MTSTQFKVGGIFGDIINKDTISLEQKTKCNNFLAKVMPIC